MISLENNIILADKVPYDITGFEVWFVVPEGLCVTITEALDDAARLSYNPELIKPICVAVCRNEDKTLIMYEVFVR